MRNISCITRTDSTPLDDRCGPFDFIVDGLARREHLDTARIRPVRVAPKRQRGQLPGFAKVPHFTSVINWTLRLGLGLLNQVGAIDVPWLAIIDHSIDIGTKKALVVLRVKLDALLKRGAAIRLVDCECIGLTIREKVNGEIVAADLEAIFMRAGTPPRHCQRLRRNPAEGCQAVVGKARGAGPRH